MRLTTRVAEARILVHKLRSKGRTALQKFQRAEALLTKFRFAVRVGLQRGKIDPALAQRVLGLLLCCFVPDTHGACFLLRGTCDY